MHLRYLWGMPIALTLLACGSDSGTSSDAPQDTTTIYVNESSRVISMHLRHQESACVMDDSDKLAWKTLTSGETDKYYRYDFIGDSLALFGCISPYCRDDSDLDGEILAGGKAGQLYGTWKSTPCTLHNGIVSCSDDSYMLTYSYTFTEDSFESKLDYDEDNEEGSSIKLTQSLYMANLLRVLNGESRYQGIGSLFEDSKEEVDQIIDTNENKVQFKSASAMEVTIRDKVYSIKLDDMTGEEFYQCSISLSVKSGKTSCSLQVENSEDITRSMCSEKERDYLSFIDVDGTLVADTYQKSNEKEFVNCLKKITGNSDIVYEFFAAKKSNRTMPGSLPRRLSR